MKTFRQEQNGQLRANLKTAVKNTMKAVVKAGKELPKHISKGVIVAAAALVLTPSNADAQGLLGKVLNKATHALAKVEEKAYEYGKPFHDFNRQYDRTGYAISDTDAAMRGTDQRLGGVISTGANIIGGLIHKSVGNQAVDAMDQQSVGTVPLIAEEHAQTVSGGQRVAYSNSTNSVNSTGLNVVGEISLDELAARSRGNTTVLGNATVSSTTSQSFTSTSGEYTLDELAAYTNAHSQRSSVTTVKAKQEALQSQKTGDIKAKKVTQTPKKKDTKELYQQMLDEKYFSR